MENSYMHSGDHFYLQHHQVMSLRPDKDLNLTRGSQTDADNLHQN